MKYLLVLLFFCSACDKKQCTVSHIEHHKEQHAVVSTSSSFFIVPLPAYDEVVCDVQLTCSNPCQKLNSKCGALYCNDSGEWVNYQTNRQQSLR